MKTQIFSIIIAILLLKSLFKILSFIYFKDLILILKITKTFLSNIEFLNILKNSCYIYILLN